MEIKDILNNSVYSQSKRITLKFQSTYVKFHLIIYRTVLNKQFIKIKLLKEISYATTDSWNIVLVRTASSSYLERNKFFKRNILQ